MQDSNGLIISKVKLKDYYLQNLKIQELVTRESSQSFFI